MKSIFLILMVFGIVSCSNSPENVELTCSSDYSDKRMRVMNNYFSSDGNIVAKSLRKVFRDNAQQCIDNFLPAEEYVITFKKSFLDNVGKYSVGMIKRYCEWSGAESFRDDEYESLQEMHVTNKNLTINSDRKLIIERKTMQGRKSTIYGGDEYGPFKYECTSREF
ncbi:MAG: hypothetical protein HN522_03245 [Flavobacteriales bacterium]|jgi:hypothetical protein|nr:hypothetical protein [Flavobacteriales bacterium]